MNTGELFTRVAVLLPGAVRERLDGDFPLDWTVLEDAGIGAEIDEAVRVRRCLPRPVEVLVHRLIRDVGIVPADVAAGVERRGAASAWIHWVTIEADGESYQLRNDRSGDVHTDVRPETVAGYATLGMDLSTLLHDTVERWLEAGEHHRATTEDQQGHPASRLAKCAVRMHAHLQAQPETISGHRTAASLARTLEYAWNTQKIEVRAALSGIRFSTARGARAPRASYYAPVTGHRLHACDAGEIRWLRALAERAGMGAGKGEPGGTGPETHSAGRALPAPVGKGAAGNGRGGSRGPGSGPKAERSGAGRPGAGTLKLGSDPAGLRAETEMAELERIASHLPEAVRQRMGEAYGPRVADALKRFETPRKVDAPRAEAESATPGQEASAPRWLVELTAALLVDSGARTREGLHTASMRLDPRRQPDGGRRATEVETGAFGHLTPAGLIEQARMALEFARDAWSGLAALRSAGKEGEWALREVQAGNGQLSASERETLEVARDIGQVLDRVQSAHAAARGDRAPSALDQAAMTAEVLKTVGPTVRTAAGWPGAARAPNARDPVDVARTATVAEGLHGEIRAVANRLIAGWVAEVQAYGESRNA